MCFRGCPQLRHEDCVRLLVVDPNFVEQAAGRLEVSVASGQGFNEEVSLAGDRSEGAYVGEGHDLILWTMGCATVPPTARPRCVLSPVRREALVDRVGGERPSPPSRRSGAVKLRAACPGRCRARVGAALTKPSRVGTARRRGCGERGGQAYVRNRRSTPLNDAPARTWRIWAARRRAPASFMTGAGNFPGGRRTDGKAVVTCCGVTPAMSQGPSRVPLPPSDQQVNTGTTLGLPGGHVASVAAQAGSTVGRSARGGAEPS